MASNYHLRCFIGLAWVCLWATLAPGTGDAGQTLKAPQPPARAAATENAPPLEASFLQVDPAPPDRSLFERTAGQARAVVLIHGLHLHPFSSNNVRRAVFHSWQKSRSPLVQALRKHADVFAFAYGQNVPVEAVAAAPELVDGVRSLKKLGYKDIVLVGHSAGGLVAAYFIEDRPHAGVTKVVQICCPNGGCSVAKVKAVRKNQRPFLDSLTKEARALALKKRAETKIPDTVEFVCLVGDGALIGDGVVSKSCQWPEHLQKQGIPAVAVRAAHFTVMRRTKDAEEVVAQILRSHPRWDPKQVAAARKSLRD